MRAYSNIDGRGARVTGSPQMRGGYQMPVVCEHRRHRRLKYHQVLTVRAGNLALRRGFV